MKKYLLKISFILIVLLTLTACSNHQNKHSTRKADNISEQVKLNHRVTSTPTLFFHGALATYRNEENIVQAVQRAGLTNCIVRIDVDADGKPTLVGRIPADAINPVVMVNYKNNVQLDYEKAGKYAVNAVRLLQNKYDIQKVNMVAHSLGNMSVMYYQLAACQNVHLPKVVKQVNIAGHFDGVNFKQLPQDIRQPTGLVTVNGRPNKMNSTYRQMTKLREELPRNQVSVLNIVGNTGKNSDGLISNASSLSLGYLMKNAKSYEVYQVTGYYAEHGRLTFSREVEQKIISFLWTK